MINKDILKTIITKEDLLSFLNQINLVRKLVFKEKDVLFSQKIAGQVSADFQCFINNLEREGLIPQDPEKIESFLEELKTLLQNIPQIKIEIAFRPTKEFVEKIVSFLETEVGEKIILDLVVNPDIIGGAIIEFRGKYLDYSLLKKINEVLQLKS